MSNLAPRREPGDRLYHRIYERIRDGILGGTYPAGSRLPSARALAAQLAVARGTVEAAYQMLAGEGYCTARGPAGTFVERIPPSRPAPPTLPRGEGTGARGDERARAGARFRIGIPAFDAFPRKAWARLAARAARRVTEADLDYPEPFGLPELRRAIARHIALARGVVCAPERIVVTSGFQGALALIGDAVLRRGDAAWVEDPSYVVGTLALALAGARIVGVPVDADGLDVAAGRRLAPGARLAMVTPCHQFPTGVALPIARRRALLAWAARAGAWIVEDDYDSEFRYEGRPLPALKSLDAEDRVIYAGTFSKALFPGLRLGYLALPEALAGRVRDVGVARHPPPPVPVQSAVLAALEEGLLARHVRRMRSLYAERRRALRDALGGMGADVLAPPGGMHLILRLPRGVDDAALAEALSGRDLWPSPLSRFGVAIPAGPGLLIGFTNVPTSEAAQCANRLRKAIGR